MRPRIALIVMIGACWTPGPETAVVRGAEDDLAKELPRIKPLETEAALKSFRIHAGFRVEPVAVEPVVTDPVSACYDADGRLYVAEMRGYPFPEAKASGHVSLLDDRDADGRFETSTVFVDGLSWPTSVLPYDGGVFIAAVPDILYAKDTDGDGKADVRKVVFTGFSAQNVQGLLNGLLWGPDGWVYGVSGGNGGEIRNPAQPDRKPVSIRGRDFRFRPDGSAFEAVSGGGQFGHSFDDWGRRFTCNNSNHIRQIVLPSRYLERNPALAAPAVVDDIAAEGAAAPVFRISPPEPWRVIRTRQRAADPVMSKRLPRTELFATGFFTSATGVTIYRGTAFPPEFRGNAFVGDVGGNLVHRKLLTKNGAEFLATRADAGVEFLASTDNWFRPVNFANTPDGTLLVLDMYRETIEHPLSIPEPIKKHLDLTSGKDRGRLYAVVPEGFRRRPRPALSAAATPDLVARLADPDAWWRETAQRLLIEKKDPGARPILKELARRRPNALARVHALWTLDVLGALDAEDLILALSDPEPGVREQAVKLTEGRTGGNGLLLTALLIAAPDPDPMVRFQAALSLGDVEGPKALPTLAAIARQDAGDRWTRLAVMSSLRGRALAFLDRLASRPQGYLDTPPGRVWLEEIAALVGAENRPDDLSALLERFAGPASGSEPGRLRTVLLGFSRGIGRAGGSLRPVFRGPQGERLAPVVAAARETAGSDRPTRDRVAAIQLVGLGPADDAFETLPGLLDARQPTEVQLAALRALAGLPDRRVGPSVLARWKALSPSVRREAVEVLFARPERLSALLDAVEAKTVTASDLDPARRQQLLALGDRSLRDRARKLLAGDTPADRARVLSDYRKALDLTGDRARGRTVFRKACATCHKAEGQGTDVGPNLATVTARTPEDLLTHILDPNREVAAPYVNYTVATTDGRVVTGLIAEESANAVTLKRAEGVTDVVPRDRIEAIASTGLSLMPEGLEKGFEPQDLADLIAYLRGITAGGGGR
jgi:putative membrane-bound dehydrogenase-like protein